MRTLPLPQHMVALPDPAWGVWRWMGLRSAGVPTDLVNQVISPDCARAAAEIVALETEVAETRRQVDLPVRQALRQLAGTTVNEDEQARKRVLRKLLRDLDRGNGPSTSPAELAVAIGPVPAEEATRVAEAMADHVLALTRHERVASGFVAQYTAATAGEAMSLRSALRHPLIAGAMMWQNRHSLRRVDRRLAPLDMDAPLWTPNGVQRKDLQLVLSYLQRYCAKNETIGFFGPMTWVKLDPHAPLLAARHGPGLVSARTLRLESWGVEELARCLAGDERLWPWLVPKRLPMVGVTARAAHQPLSPLVELSEDETRVLLCCDGAREVREIAAELYPELAAAGLAQVIAVLERLAKSHLVDVGLPIPLALHPERALRDRLANIDPPELRAEASAPLEELVRAAQHVAEATDDLDRLSAAFEHLDSVFTAITQQEATRAPGQMYAARTLVYEECSRDVEVRLGPALLADIGEPLSFVLHSGRWLCWRVLQVVELVMRRTYRELAARSGATEVGLPDLWLRVHELLFEPDSRLLKPVLADFRRRWSTVLAGRAGEGGSAGVEEVSFDAEELRDRLREQFDCVGSRVRAARYFSPDIMVAAASAEAACRDEYQAVLGELHMASNTLVPASFVSVHPSKDELVSAWEHDHGGSYVSATPAREWGFTVRTAAGVRGDTDVELLIARDARAVRPDRALMMGDLVVADRAGTLVARDRGGRYEGELLDTLGEALAPIMTDLFAIMPAAPYRPRLRIGRLVISRRAWRVPAHEMTFAELREPHERFLGARRFMSAHRLPGRVFVRVPTERKPVYVDLDSVTSVDLLCRLVRSVLDQDTALDQDAAQSGSRSDEITFGEMLPDMDGLWLSDVEGQRYTSEFRLVAVDLRSTAGPEEIPPMPAD